MTNTIAFLRKCSNQDMSIPKEITRFVMICCNFELRNVYGSAAVVTR